MTTCRGLWKPLPSSGLSQLPASVMSTHYSTQPLDGTEMYMITAKHSLLPNNMQIVNNWLKLDQI